MKLADEQFAELGPDLALAGLEFSAQRPKRFPKHLSSHAYRGDEEALETLMLLHFEAFFNVAPLRVAIGRPNTSEADIVALDSLGRVHIVEAKEGVFGQPAFEQALQYALRFIFFDAKHALFEPDRVKEGSQEWLAKRVAGVWAATRSSAIGPGRSGRDLVKEDDTLARHLRETFGETKWSRGKWAALTPEQRARVVHEYLYAEARLQLKDAGARVKRQRVDFPAFDELWRIAGEWASRLDTPLKGGPTSPDNLVLDANRPLVLWLVGAGFSEAALEGVKYYRALGMDVRPMAVNYRSEPGTQRWFLQRQMEDFPLRAQLERRVVEKIGTKEFESPEKRTLEFRLYNVKTPASKFDAAHGDPLTSASASFQSGGRRSTVTVP